MTFNHQAISGEVESFLGCGLQQVTVAADMTDVRNDGHIQSLRQLDGDFPHREIAVRRFLVIREPAMDGRQLGQACLLETLKGTHPEVQVGRNGVFDEHGDVGAAQGIGQLLHRERIDHRPCPNPQRIDFVFQSQLDMLGGSHFGGGGQAGFVFRFAKPNEALLSPALKGIGAGARFPDTASEHGHFGDFGQGTCRGEDLGLAFYATGAGEDKGITTR